MQVSRHILRFAFALPLLIGGLLYAQPASHPKPNSAPAIKLQESSRKTLASEMGAFMFPAKCDADGNLYIRKYATDRPLLSPIVKINAEGKRTASFDPIALSQLKLTRTDSFSPSADGGIDQIAGVGIVKPQIYVLHYSSDGSASSPIQLDADFQPYEFAAFANGNLLVSGIQRDLADRSDPGHPVTAVFSADGRMLTPISFAAALRTAAPIRKTGAVGKTSPENRPVTLDLSGAEPGQDGNIYALRRSSPALIYGVSPAGKILRTLKINPPAPDLMPNAFHVSSNRVATSYMSEDFTTIIVVTDLLSGRRIATYSFFEGASSTPTVAVSDSRTGKIVETESVPGAMRPAFVCYSPDEEVFTFLQLGEGGALEVIRAEPH
ncbi:MAG: hypothetical protein HY010_09880 [Acidobacteria bacterium]|nr:hypothetical protein [Acidobacteriota bacterium]